MLGEYLQKYSPYQRPVTQNRNRFSAYKAHPSNHCSQPTKGVDVRNVIIIVIAVVMLSACIRPHYELDSSAKSKLSTLPGSLELEIVEFEINLHHDQKLMTYAIANGELLLKTTKTCVRPHISACYFSHSKQYILFPENARYEKTPVAPPKGLPKVEGYQYIGPFSVSPDNSIAFLSITPESYRWPQIEYPMDIVLIEMGTKKVVFQTNRRNLRHLVEDVAWSPDSKLFAVLYESFQRYHGPLGIIGNLLGHPVDKYTYYLSIYDRQGSSLVQSRGAYGLVTSWGNIRFYSWRPKETVPQGRLHD